MRSLTFEVPLPPEELSPNFRSRTHHAKARATAAYRLDCTTVARATMARERHRGFYDSVTVHLAFYMAGCTKIDKRARFRDGDNANASCKALIDAMKDAGMVAGDTARRVTLLPPTLLTRKKEHQGRACVVVTVEQP